MKSELRFFLTGLQLMFIGLKLGRVLDWSWLWVLSPLWVPGAVATLSLWILWIMRAAVETPRERSLRKAKEALIVIAKRSARGP